MCVLPYSTTQLEPATLHVVNCHTGLVAIIVDSSALNNNLPEGQNITLLLRP